MNAQHEVIAATVNELRKRFAGTAPADSSRAYIRVKPHGLATHMPHGWVIENVTAYDDRELIAEIGDVLGYQGGTTKAYGSLTSIVIDMYRVFGAIEAHLVIPRPSEAWVEQCVKC